jgi:hypothetical protein
MKMYSVTAAALAAAIVLLAHGAAAQMPGSDMSMNAAVPSPGAGGAPEMSYEDTVRDQLKQVDAKLESLKKLKAKIRDGEDLISERKTAMIQKQKAAVEKDLVTVGTEMGESLAKTKEEISAKIKKMDDEIDRWTAERRERYADLMEKELAYYKAQMQKFQGKIKEKTGESKSALDQKSEDLQKKQDDAQNRLTLLKAADPKAWEENKSLTDKAIEAVKDAYNKLTSSEEE